MVLPSRFALLFPVLMLSVSSVAFAATEKIGENEFQTNCAACHGMDAKGNGPMVEWLTVKPKPLHTLAKRNSGVFPWQRVYGILAGTQPVKLHGPTDMPVWGGRYAEKTIREEGEYAEATVRGRVLELVFYLATIQE
jgi:mono/diheme cytochrome c family protein